MVSFEEKFALIAEKMRKENLPEIAIKNFEFYYRTLLEGHTGFISESEIQPVKSLPDLESLSEDFRKVGEAHLKKTVIIKLNGGLGTSMGLNKAKSLLLVKNNYCFLDIIARQAILSKVPLVLMNSFSTRKNSLKVLEKYPELKGNIPLDFVQHKVPKIAQSDLSPISWPQNPQLEWCPPGHGDLYVAMVTSGILDTLLDHGYEYAFVSNSDNLGAVLSTAILGYFVKNRLPFLMEVADRTEADKKGGHLAQLPNGQFILREIAQCPPEDLGAFQDIRKYKYFNTNSLWIHLRRLKEVMAKKDNILGLPMIRNEKTVDPRDPSSPKVYQLETAMGAAISVFEGAGAIRVPRQRFAPVKNTNDLLAVRSDCYILTEQFQIIPNSERTLPPIFIQLDSSFFKKIDDFEERFPFGPPSLKECQQLIVEGDFKFGKDLILRGKVHLINKSEKQIFIQDGTVIEGTQNYT